MTNLNLYTNDSDFISLVQMLDEQNKENYVHDLTMTLDNFKVEFTSFVEDNQFMIVVRKNSKGNFEIFGFRYGKGKTWTFTDCREYREAIEILNLIAIAMKAGK